MNVLDDRRQHKGGCQGIRASELARGNDDAPVGAHLNTFPNCGHGAGRSHGNDRDFPAELFLPLNRSCERVSIVRVENGGYTLADQIAGFWIDANVGCIRDLFNCYECMKHYSPPRSG